MAALGSGSGNGWEIMVSDLAAGRYVLQITGETRGSGPSTYTGQLAFAVPEPATLAMLGLAAFV